MALHIYEGSIMKDPPPIFGPDITEAEARATLCEALGCRPDDICISRRWTVITPNPKATGKEHQAGKGGQFIEHTEALKQAVQRILACLE